ESVRTGVDPGWFEARQFALPSRRVTPNSDFEQYARECFPPGANILECAQRLTERIYTEFKYAPGATDVNTPVETALSQKHGVCQDFAHVQIACLRSIGLSARYVSGYLRTLPPPGKPRLVGADQSHAWLSLYCGGLGWVDLDPTNNCMPGSEHITIAHGRDYEDVVPVRGVFLGGGSHKISVSVDVEPF
ncbi:MAG TPA: transglutaminase, partial [Planctomycetaceae bacterium]|nr:transglutaminase [Planctomycetaceae bacterium]